VSTYLVVLDGANAEQEVLASLASVRQEDATARFTLLVPADRRRHVSEGECWLEAAQRANTALETLKALGLDVSEAIVGDFMRRKAIGEELRRAEQAYEAVLLFTVPFQPGMDVSRIVPVNIALQGDADRAAARFGSVRRLLVQKYASTSQRN
jgi:hypothetical protein